MAAKNLRIGLAGLGTVGGGVLTILRDRVDELQAQTGCLLDVVAVSANNKNKKRSVDISDLTWVDNPVDLVHHHNVDVVVETMGGDGDPALALVKASLQAKKPVVTANKALLAHHGQLLARLADDFKTPLMYEAAVAGGIPIIKMLREGLAANQIDAVYGILNGTCNYILTTMEQTGKAFAETLKEAQALGYAEADPELDVGGGDSGHKLVLLAALAFGCTPDFARLSLDGITRLTFEDIATAKEFGYRIKLVGQAQRMSDGRVLQMVAPSLVPTSSPLAHVSGVLNGVATVSNYAGATFIAGRGAGAGPTASAIVADLIDLARGGATLPVFGRNPADMTASDNASFADWTGEFYMRLSVRDQPGVIADIAPILRDHDISIESLIQRGRSESPDQPVNIIIFTHKTAGRAMQGAVQQIAKLGAVMESPLIMPLLAL